MFYRPATPHPRRAILARIYTSTFFFTLASSLTFYVDSSFVGSFIGEQRVGIVFAAAYVAVIAALFAMPILLRRFGNFAVALALIILQAVVVAVIAVSTTAEIVLPLFAIQQILLTLIFFTFDVFLENASFTRAEGTIRGIMLTLFNVALIAGPLVSGYILTNGSYGDVYAFSGTIMFFVSLFVLFALRGIPEPSYERHSAGDGIRFIFKRKHPDDGLRHIILSNFLLQFFYAWMVIYTPLYLHDHVGFSWAQIGVILPLMLFAFVLLEIPFGKIADATGQERAMVAGGFVIASLSTAMLAFFESDTVWAWAAILFATRVGASMIEVGTESYFFKQINDTEINLISIFRDMHPIAYITAPLLGSFFLAFVSFEYLYLVLGLLLGVGAFAALRMRDTAASAVQTRT